jgi:hypothetical protein
VPKSNPDRRRDRNQRAVEMFGHQAQAALDALALLDFAWHDCYGQSAPPDRVIEDIWKVANGDLGRLISAAHLAVIDFRDLRLNAQDAKPSSETT